MVIVMMKKKAMPITNDYEEDDVYEDEYDE